MQRNFLSKPPTIGEPYTEFKGEYVPKLRRVVCEQCKYETVTTIPGARCAKCNSYLIEYISHELARQYRGPT